MLRSIIIVVDGVDNLRTEDGGESLSWLPNHLPAGIRILLSTMRPQNTAHLPSCRWIVRRNYAYDSEYDIYIYREREAYVLVIIYRSDDLIFDPSLPVHASDTHIMRELRRRSASFLLVEPLDERMSTEVIAVHTYIHTYIYIYILCKCEIICE
jgi:hypothetical protein